VHARFHGTGRRRRTFPRTRHLVDRSGLRYVHWTEGSAAWL